MTPAAIALACALSALVGGGATWALTRPGSDQGAADTVEAAVAPQVEEQQTARQVTETDRLAWVCTGEHYDEALCAALQVCHLTAAEGAEAIVICNEMVNLYLTAETWDLCESAPDEEARDRCYRLHERRK